MSTTTSITPNLCQVDAVRLPFPDRSFDLVIGSPPYCDARTYGIGAQRNARQWVEWMLAVTTEALRVSKGAVIWVAAGVTRDRTYWPACEGLMWEWFAEGWTEHGPRVEPSGVWQDGIELRRVGKAPGGSAYRPCYWHRVGIPGSGGDQWYRADVELCMVFKRPGALPYAMPLNNGKPPAYGPGGQMGNRLINGLRVNDPWRKQGRGNGLGGRRANGKKNLGTTADIRVQVRLSASETNVANPAVANPGTLLSTGAGGGNNLGHELAHESEAPFPEAVPRFFIRSHCPPDGIVLDPFGGSGTTGAAAVLEGRRYVLCDIRAGVGALDTARRRLAHSDRYGIKDNPSLAGPPPVAPMPGQMSLLD